MNLDELSAELNDTAVEKGFWSPLDRMDPQDGFVFFAKQLAMIHSEVTEVLEAMRKDKGQDQVVEELADILIRVFDIYGGLKRYGAVEDSLHDTLIRKASFNKTRDRLHGVAG